MLTLAELYKLEKEQEQVLLANIRPDNEGTIINFLSSKNKVFGTYEASLGNFTATRHYFYQCGRLDTMLVRKYNNRLFDHGLNNLCIALLSDCEPMIKEYATLRYQKAANSSMSMEEVVAKGGMSIWVHSLFMIIQDNKEALATNIERIRKTKVHKAMVCDVDFLQGMLNNNKEAVGKTLQEMVKPANHKLRIDPPDPAGECLFLAAAGYAKLARMKGMNIQLSSPVVPEGLISIAPLPEYNDAYDFVKEYLG